MTSNKPTGINDAVASDDRALRHIDTLILDGAYSRNMRRTLFGVVLIVVVFVVWSVVAKVDELARARGEIQPGGHIQVLQSEEGGSIVKLYVKEGDAVKAGDLIADFAATDLGKLKRQTEIKIAAIEIDRERMQAILANRKPDFSKYEQNFPLLVAQAKVTYSAAVASRDSALSAKLSEGGQQGAMLAGSQRDKVLIEKQISEAKERLRRIEDGALKGVVTQLALSDARQQVTSLEERLSDVTARAAGTQSSIGGVNAEAARLRADLNQQLSMELSKLTEQYRELFTEQSALDERQGRSDLKSPVDGIVMNLPQTGEGAVVSPGGVVAEIVPTGKDIVMEVMVTPRDIGFVRQGQRARVKVDSFDSARFGAVEGIVRRIAPTSSKLRESGMPYYKVEISLNTPYVGAPSRQLIAGMTGEADIATGTKSVMQFLLKPVFTAADTAFHER